MSEGPVATKELLFTEHPADSYINNRRAEQDKLWKDIDKQSSKSMRMVFVGATIGMVGAGILTLASPLFVPGLVVAGVGGAIELAGLGKMIKNMVRFKKGKLR